MCVLIPSDILISTIRLTVLSLVVHRGQRANVAGQANISISCSRFTCLVFTESLQVSSINQGSLYFSIELI